MAWTTVLQDAAPFSTVQHDPFLQVCPATEQDPVGLLELQARGPVMIHEPALQVVPPEQLPQKVDPPLPQMLSPQTRVPHVQITGVGSFEHPTTTVKAHRIQQTKTPCRMMSSTAPLLIPGTGAETTPAKERKEGQRGRLPRVSGSHGSPGSIVDVMNALETPRSARPRPA
jgi:hypothetical protein